MKDVIYFLHNPILIEKYDYSKKNIKSVLINTVIFSFSVRFLLAILLFLEKVYHLEGVSTILKYKMRYDFTQTNYWYLIMLIIVAPICEEIAFRGFFTKNRKLQIMSLSFLLVLLSNFFYLFFKNALPIHGIMRLFISLIMFVILYFFLLSKREFISNFIFRKTRLVLYISIILFSCIHIPNFNLSNLSANQLMLLPIALIPYLSLATATSYLRFRLGIWLAIGLHCLNNLIASISFLI